MEGGAEKRLAGVDGPLCGGEIHTGHEKSTYYEKYLKPGRKGFLTRSKGLAHWGSSTLTGRGLVALSGSGQIYQVSLKAGEEYVAHPRSVRSVIASENALYLTQSNADSNVLAYAISQTPPTPYRFKSTSLRLQIPSLTSLFPNIKFFRVMRETPTYKAFANTLLTIRSLTRRTIWGDRVRGSAPHVLTYSDL